MLKTIFNLVLILLLILAFFGHRAYAASEEAADAAVECPYGSRACKVNKQIDEVEKTVEDVADQYKGGKVWRHFDKEGVTSGKHRILEHIAMGPTYVMRALTWPMAVFSGFLIRKGVVRDVVDVISNDERTFWVYPKFELGFGSGFGGGVGIRHTDLFERNYRFRASYLVHVNLDQRGDFSFEKPDAFYIANRPFGFTFFTKLLHDKNTDFYGVGIGAQESARSKYRIDSIDTGFGALYEPLDHFIIAAGLGFAADYTDTGTQPSVQTVFPMSELSGFGRDIAYLAAGIRLKHDTRDAEGRPEKGGVRELAFTRFQGLGVNGLDYNQYDLDVAQYLKLWLPRHVLALRTKWEYRQPTSGGNVPFFRLSRLDVYTPLRGFDFGRFMDRGLYVFNIEYRFPVWDYLDGEFFFDTGRVFHTLSDISFKHLKYSGGAGLRLCTKNFFLARIQVAYGGEGVNFLFKTSQAF
ncbi:MAG: BamA/TamA family outer membrane protein [Pseudomonadota bacterium]